MVYEKTANDDTLEYLSFVFEDKFRMDEITVQRCLRTIPNHDDLASKFRLLESHGVFEQADFKTLTITEFAASPFYRCTYDELLFAVHIPKLLSFSDTLRDEYHKRVLYWSRFMDIRPEVLPLLEKICGEETANFIICQLYIHSYTTVSSQSIKDICDTLLRWPDSTTALPGYMRSFWYPVFSEYSNPQDAIFLISEIFDEEHVLEIFTDTPSWSKLGYRHEPAIIQKIMAVQRDHLLESAKTKFERYLKR